MFGQTQPSSIFGGGQATGGLFGTQPAPQSGGGLFGGGGLGGTTPTLATSTLFGSAAPASTSGGLFGGTTTASTLFGSSAGISGISAQPAGLFGAGAAQPSTGGLFGGASAQPSAGGLFGATQPTAALGFGSTPTLGGGLSFGAPAQGFGQKPLFGATATAPTTGGLFGAPNPGATGSLFGGQTQPMAAAFNSFGDMSQQVQEPPGTQQDEFKPERVKDNFQAQAYNMNNKYQPFSLKLLRLKDYNDFKQGKVHPKIMNDLQSYVAVCKGQIAGNDPKGSSPFGGQSTFSSGTTGGIFGGQTSQPAQSGGGLFGAIGSQPAAQTGGLFGAGSFGTSAGGMASGATGGLFGGAPAQPTGGLFGATSPQPATGGLFGQPAQGGGLFGAGQQPAAGGGLFGASASPQPQTGGLFGAGGGGMMGGQPAGGGGLFGGAAQTQPSGGLFGAQSPAPGGGLFGGAQPSGGLFGGQTGGGMGGATGGLFGASNPNGAFGGLSNPAAQVDPNATLNALNNLLQLAAKSMAINQPNQVDQRSQNNRKDDEDGDFSDAQKRNRKYSQDRRDYSRNNPPSEETEIDQLRRDHLAQIQSQQRLPHFSSGIGSNPLNHMNAAPTLFEHRTKLLTKQKHRPVIDSSRHESSKNASLFGHSTASTIRDARSASRLDDSALSLSRFQSTDAGTGLKISIDIQIENGSTLQLSVSPTDVVSEVIRKLIDELGHPQNSKEAQDYGTNWEFCYEGKKLSPISRLLECSVLPLKDNPKFSFRKVSNSSNAAQTRPYELAPTEAIPILTKEGYSTSPEYSRICRMSEQELRQVSNFEIRHRYATISFLGKTDLRGVNIDEAIKIQHRVVEIYPDDVQKPQKGQGLNKPATITLKQFGLKQKNNNDKYISTLKAKLAEMNSILIGADFAEDSIKFQVEGSD